MDTRAAARPRPRACPASIDAAQVRQLKADGVSPSEIARRLGIGRASVYRALAENRDILPSRPSAPATGERPRPGGTFFNGYCPFEQLDGRRPIIRDSRMPFRPTANRL